jgi:hypothetical protein
MTSYRLVPADTPFRGRILADKTGLRKDRDVC